MRVDTDDFGRPCRCGKEHHIEVEEILIEAGAVEKLEEAMSDGFLKEYISPLLICDTNTLKATEECLEDIYDRSGSDSGRRGTSCRRTRCGDRGELYGRGY